MQDKKSNRLFKNTLTIFVGTFSAKILSLILVTMYTYYMSTEDMGYYDLVVSSVNLCRPIVTLSLFEGVFRWLLDQNHQHKDVIKNSGLVLLYSLLTFDSLYLIFTLFYEIQWSYVILLMINLDCIYYCLQYATRGLKHLGLFSLQGVVYAVVMIVSSYIFVCRLGLGSLGLIWSVNISSTAAIMLMLITQKDILNMRSGKRDKGMQKDMIKYSMPLILNATSWWGVNTSNRWLISIFLGVTYNGIFSIACKFPSVVQMLSTIFYQAWQEQAIVGDDSEKRNKYYSYVFKQYYFFLFTGILVLIPITLLYIKYFVEADYQDASNYIAFLYIGTVFASLSSFLGVGYLSSKNTQGAMSTTVLGMVVSIAISLIFLKKIGLQAASLAIMSGNITVFISRFIQTRKYYKISIKWSSFIGLLSVCICFAIMSLNANFVRIITMLIMGCSIMSFANKKLISTSITTIISGLKQVNGTKG